MKEKNKTLSEYKYIVALILIYFAAHGISCVISGIWWDDWTIWMSSSETIKNTFWSNGLPWEAYNLFSVMWIPNNGYKIIVFLLFLLGGIFFYNILLTINLFNEKDAFWIAAIYMTVPVNDARITLICYGYTLSLFLFLLAFFLITKMEQFSLVKRRIVKVISLLLFLYSYTTASLLVMMCTVWLYLLYKTIKTHKGKSYMAYVKTFVLTYWDFLILPFIYFFIKNIFFRPSGRYANYNSVTTQALVKGVVLAPFASVKTFAIIVYNYCKQFGLISIILIAFIVVVYFVKVGKKDFLKEKKQIKRNLLMFGIGALAYMAGVFPYIVVRAGAIVCTGVGGRDSMMAGFGISIMLYSFVKLTNFPHMLQKTVFITAIILGIFHFNNWYLNYQEDWYQQLRFANEVAENKELKNDTTVLCDFSYESPCGATRFYTLNGISYYITGKKDKFYMSSIQDLQYGVEYNIYFKEGFNADDYDFYDTTVDSVLVIDNIPIENKKLLRLRFDEIFRPKVFKNNIDALCDIEYVSIPEQLSEEIYNVYFDNQLNSEILRGLVREER